MIISELVPTTVTRVTSPEHNAIDRASTRAVAEPVLSFDPPLHDHEWTMVPNSKESGYLRDEVIKLLKAMERIHFAKSKTKERMLIAQDYRQQRGFTEESLKRKYELFVYGGCKKRCKEHRCDCPARLRFAPGDWRCLVDMARMPGQEFNHNRFSTVQFFITLCERYQRNSKRAWEQFCTIARNIRDSGIAIDADRREHKNIPGLDVRDPAKWNPKGEFPIGCSYEQLMREAKDLGFDDYTQKRARVGRFAASAFRIKVYTDRSQLPFFARLQHDDHEDNTKIKWPDSLKFLRPRGFYSLEQLSGDVFKRVLKPTLWDLDDAKKKALAGVDFQWHFLSIFFGVGYRHDEIGTENVLEHGTANIPEWLEENLYNASQKRIRCIRSGRFGKRAHDGQRDPSAPGHGKGNPLFKAQLESFFNLRDNAFAFLAGQTGKDREHCPEQLAGVEREALTLMRATQNMPVELAARIHWPLPSWIDYQEIDALIMNAISCDPNHNLSGWDKFITRKWRMTSDPHDPASLQWFDEEDLLALNETQRAVMEARFQRDPSLTRDVRMSRRQVFTRNCSQLRKLDWRMLPAILREEDCIVNHRSADDTLLVDQGVFTFSNQYWGPGKWRFHAINTHGRRLFNGERYKCFGIPFLPECIVACDANLRPVGICPRIDEPSQLDREGIERAVARQAAWEAETTVELNLRHEREAAHIAEEREKNATIISGKPTATRAQQRRSAAAEADEALGNLRD